MPCLERQQLLLSFRICPIYDKEFSHPLHKNCEAWYVYWLSIWYMDPSSFTSISRIRTLGRETRTHRAPIRAGCFVIFLVICYGSLPRKKHTFFGALPFRAGGGRGGVCVCKLLCFFLGRLPLPNCVQFWSWFVTFVTKIGIMPWGIKLTSKWCF